MTAAVVTEKMTLKALAQKIGLGFEVEKIDGSARDGAEPVPVFFGLVDNFARVLDFVDAIPALEKDGAAHCGQWPHLFDDGNDSWRGGRFEELKAALNGNNPKLAEYEKAKRLLEETDAFKKAVAVLAPLNPRRVRSLSDQDGEWDLDRRWDLRPFSRSRRQNDGARKVVEFEIHLSVAGWTSAEKIDQYGQVVWAVSQAFETRGVSVGITLVDASSGGVNSPIPATKKEYVGTKFRLKQPGAYINPGVLAACITSNFFRRVTWGFQVLVNASQGLTTPYGTGGAFQPKKPIEILPGKVKVSNVNLTAIDAAEALLKALAA